MSSAAAEAAAVAAAAAPAKPDAVTAQAQPAGTAAGPAKTSINHAATSGFQPTAAAAQKIVPDLPDSPGSNSSRCSGKQPQARSGHDAAAASALGMMASMAGARASTGEAGEATSQDDVANDVDADDNTDGQWMTTEEVGAAEIAIMPLGYTGGKRPADGPTRLANGVPDSEAESPKKRKYTKKVKAPSSYPCGRCDMEVADGEEAILCEQKCFKWFHRPCADLTPLAYHALTSTEDAMWACSGCLPRR